MRCRPRECGRIPSGSISPTTVSPHLFFFCSEVAIEFSSDHALGVLQAAHLSQVPRTRQITTRSKGPKCEWNVLSGLLTHFTHKFVSVRRTDWQVSSKKRMCKLCGVVGLSSDIRLVGAGRHSGQRLCFRRLAQDCGAPAHWIQARRHHPHL